MTLPGSGTLDYNSIRAEFGSPSSNVYLNLYTRGGPYAYQVPANANLPDTSTAQASVSNFYGAKNKTDYFQGNGSSYNSGGKAPTQYYGVGGPAGGSWGDSVGKIGGTAYTAAYFYSNSSIIGFNFNMGSGANDANFVSRAFACYNSSGSPVFTLTTSGVSAPVRAWPNSSGDYDYFNDSLSASIGPGNPWPAPSQTGSNTALGAYFVIKAF
tara:strand:+ start:123 stop:758 length:636 start_codon:yes stop_codon:yes gene_type:complete